MENDGVVLYSSVQNSTLNSERERSSIQIDGNVCIYYLFLFGTKSLALLLFDLLTTFLLLFGCAQEAAGIEYLLHSYPDFVAIGDIPLDSKSALDKVKTLNYYFPTHI